MKKTFLALAALLIVSGVSAQSSAFEWGVKGGLNISGITHNDLNMKPSFYVGAFAEFNINDFLGIQPEVLYSRQGDKYSSDGATLYNRFNYLNIPVLAKIYLLDALSLDLGPQFGFLLNAQQKVKDDDHKVKSDIDGAKNFDVSWAMGVSYRFLGNFDASVRYNLGLTKLADSPGDKPKNSVIQIGIGYRF